MPRRSTVNVKINPEVLKGSLSTGRNGFIVSKKIDDIIKSEIAKKQDTLIKNFYTHKVSMEIQEGPRANNSSGTLGGYGNLYSFLGFRRGDNPLMVIEEIFAKKIRYKVRGRNNRGQFLITIYVPTKKEVWEETPMPWASGMSWSKSIEKGVNNAAAYLFNPEGYKNSRSGSGLQANQRVSGVTFKKTSYITRLLADFRNDLRKL